MEDIVVLVDASSGMLSLSFSQIDDPVIKMRRSSLLGRSWEEACLLPPRWWRLASVAILPRHTIRVSFIRASFLSTPAENKNEKGEDERKDILPVRTVGRMDVPAG